MFIRPWVPGLGGLRPVLVPRVVPTAPVQGGGWFSGLGRMGDGLPVRTERISEGQQGTRETIRRMGELALAAAHDPTFVAWVRGQVADLPSKDYLGEGRRMLEIVKQHCRYVRDPLGGLELLQDPRAFLFQDGTGDCFPQGTLVLRREGHALVPIESLREGDYIWGQDKWTKVTRVWNKGVLPTVRIRLNNGSTGRLTANHKVWRLECPKHGLIKTGTGTKKSKLFPNGSACSCPIASKLREVVAVSDLENGHALLQPSRVDYGTGVMDADRAYIEGLYLSDGWSDESKKSFCISGKTGFPKEAQKHFVLGYCDRNGISTYWHHRYIAVKDPVWAARCKTMGEYAPFKRALTIDLEQAGADALLRGIMADSGAVTRGAGRCLTSTSYDLFLQARVLLKQQGISGSEAFIVDHGGLGENPIWRLTTRAPKKTHRVKPLKVVEVINDEIHLPCWDIATEDQCVWLPQADWTVHNCDEFSTALAAMALALGHHAAFRTVAADASQPDQWSHVYTLIGVDDPSAEEGVAWYPADGTQRKATFGWEPPAGKIWLKKDWIIA